MNIASALFTLTTALTLVACSTSSRSKPIDPKSQNGRYLAACEVGDGGACFELGKNIAIGSDGNKPNRLGAHKYFVAGCNNGHMKSCEIQDQLINDAADAMVRSLYGNE